MEAEINPVWVFVSSFFVAAFAGLAALLRSVTPLSTKSVCSALLNSGLLGLAISLLWYTKFQSNPFFLIGICVISGLGGLLSVDFVLKAIQGGGLKISLGDNGIVQMGGEEKK